jgi:calcium-dependent protein kinase
MPDARVPRPSRWVCGGAPRSQLRNMVVDRMRKFANGNKLQRRAILMVARELPASEVEGLRTMFKEMDADGNGVITIDEMRKALRKMGSMLPRTELEEIMAVRALALLAG